MKLAEGMTEGQVARLERLGDDRRHALLERAAIIHESHPGMGWTEAYERAFAMAGFATQQALAVTT
jgi:hypothetical protein